jgi:hypothetical protein
MLMLFEIYMTHSYVVSEGARVTVEAASDEEAVDAIGDDMDALPWETTDEEPCQDLKTACKQVHDVRPDFRVVGGKLVARES